MQLMIVEVLKHHNTTHKQIIRTQNRSQLQINKIDKDQIQKPRDNLFKQYLMFSIIPNTTQTNILVNLQQQILQLELINYIKIVKSQKLNQLQLKEVQVMLSQ